MSRRRGTVDCVAAAPTTPLVSALLEIAKIDQFSNQWRSTDDFATIVHAFLGLNRRLQLGSKYVNRELQGDQYTKPTLDSSHGCNDTGIFREKFHNKHYLYLCSPGERPPKHPIGDKWHNYIQKALPQNWNMPLGIRGTGEFHEEIKGKVERHLKSLANPNGVNKNGGRPKPGESQESKNSKKKKRKEPEQTSSDDKNVTDSSSSCFVRILTHDNKVLAVEIDNDLADKLRMAIVTSKHYVVEPNIILSEATPFTKDPMSRTSVVTGEGNNSFELATNSTINSDCTTQATTPTSKETNSTLASTVAAPVLSNKEVPTAEQVEEIPVSNNVGESTEQERAKKKQRHTNLKNVTVKENGQEFQIKNLPVTYEVTRKNVITRIQQSKETLNDITASLDRQKFQGGELATRIYGAAMVLNPGLAFSAAETLIPMIIAASTKSAFDTSS